MGEGIPPIPIEGPPTLGIVGEDGLITAKRHTRGFCTGHHFVVNEDERTVQCKKCLKAFDAIEALLYLASRPDRWRQEVASLTSTIKAQKAVLDETNRRLKNAKAAARRVGVTTPDAWEALHIASEQSDDDTKAGP